MRWQGLAIVITGGLIASAVELAAFSGGDAAFAQASAPAAQPSAPLEEIKPTPAAQPPARTPAATPRTAEALKAATDAMARRLGRDDDVAGDVRPHPLAAAYPDQNVVVCEAGCPMGRNTIVYMAPRRPSGFLQVSNLTTSSNVTRTSTGTSAPAEQPQASASLECVAGCYAQRSNGGARRPDQAASGRFQGTWLTATEPQQTTPAPAPRPRVSKASRTRKQHSSEWFTSRFSGPQRH